VSGKHPSDDQEPDGIPNPRSLRLLSFNIQNGVETQFYRDYITKSWKHLLPLKERFSNLNHVADLIGEFDVVGLQEVDSGSLRSGFLDQTEYLAHRADFPWWFRQINRNMGKIAQHSNGVLSRIYPESVHEHRLPGLRGRGAVLIELRTNTKPLVICVMHLALGSRARIRQLAYISDLIAEHPYLVVMGDFNCGLDSPELNHLIDHTHLCIPATELKTFPSWRPRHRYDHILVSNQLTVSQAKVLEPTHSDHLPVSVTLELPEHVTLRQGKCRPPTLLPRPQRSG